MTFGYENQPTMMTNRLTRRTSTLTWVTSAAAAALTLHTLVNARLLRTPPVASSLTDAPPPAIPNADAPNPNTAQPDAAAPDPATTDTSNPEPAPDARERISVLMPVRDEAYRLEPGLRSALAAVAAYGPAAELVVLDDGSSDGTRHLATRIVAEHPGARAGVVEHPGARARVRARVVDGAALPRGWLGKPWACHQLAQQADARSTVLVFVDADVLLRPHALTAAVGLLRSTGLDLVSPWPRQVANTLAERLVQPLQQWSWLTTVPLRLAERSSRPSLAAANGQLLVVDRVAYGRAGGHQAVRDEVLDDITLLRTVVRSGGHGTPVDGTDLATCRMYRGWAEVRDGYSKSLWAAFGSPGAAATVVGGLGLLYVWPALAALAGSPVGAVGYLSGVLGRAVAARRTGGRAWPDSLAHPASVVLLGWLTARSWRGRRTGTLTWKGRSVT